MQQTLFDIIIVGGSYAGLSAAMVLGRSLRKVLVIDSGKPCNRQTPYSHNYLTRDGETPAQITAIAKEQVLRYPTVTFLTDLATEAEPELAGFVVKTASGGQFTSRKLLLATGLEDIIPAISGFAECWGRSVLHCPYCHGYEIHGQRLGILAAGDTAYELVRLIQNWGSDLTLFTNGPAMLTPEQRQLITLLNVPIIETELALIEHSHGQLTALRFVDNSTVELDALYSRVPFRQHSDLAERLGCLMTETGLIAAKEFGQTNVPGVYVVGDSTTMFRQVSIAVANGGKAGAWLNRELIDEDLEALVSADIHK